MEPFAGMLGVLLSRAPAGLEIANDAHGDVVNWWRCVRDRGEQLAAKLALTPRSRELWEEARGVLFDPSRDDPLERAAAFTICTLCGMARGPKVTDGFGVVYKPTVGRMMYPADLAARLGPLASRLADVQLERRDGLDLLERLADVPEALVYCDPLYHSSDTSPYGDLPPLDVGRMAELLRAQRGRVAISGYRDEWDALGWRRETLEVASPMGAHHGSRMTRKPQQARLWLNWEAGEYRGLLA